jgi:DNA (cytosine-5)-methyltransferase 1
MLAIPMMGRLSDASEITAVVDYCGAGGESQGLVEAGITVVQAANHFDKAIETHAANHSGTDHLLTDLLVQDPRLRPRAHIYQASPECTWHSPAGGRKNHRYRDMLDMFDDYVPDAAGERSRATMMTVLGMAEAKRYPIVIVENVVEVSRWEMFEVWLAGFTALGYQHQILSVSAAHIWSERNAPAPQWRDRIYFVFYLEGIEFPDVSPRPWGHCEACGADVRLMQSWKKPGRPIGKYRSQYVYRCPVLGHPIAEPYVMPALDALDLSDLGTRIGDRKRPLSAATMRRIRTGALMFNREPEIVAHTGHTWDATKKGHRRYGDPNGYHRVWPAADPLMARTSGPGDAVHLASVRRRVGIGVPQQRSCLDTARHDHRGRRTPQPGDAASGDHPPQECGAVPRRRGADRDDGGPRRAPRDRERGSSIRFAAVHAEGEPTPLEHPAVFAAACDHGDRREPRARHAHATAEDLSHQ